MDSILRSAYIEEHCNACGGSYRMTLYDALAEHQIEADWESGRRCELCETPRALLVSVLPRDLLEDLNRTWLRVKEVAEEAQLDLKVCV
jgi:hypothetical protein